MNNNTENYEYYIKRGVVYARGLERVNYGQTGLVTTDASTGVNYCWFIPDGEGKPAIKLETKHVYTQDVGYIDGTEYIK